MPEQMPIDHRVDDLSATIEKLECVLSLSGYAIGAADEKRLMAMVMAIVRDYVQELRRIACRMSGDCP
jgi:hypothetical protein